jgi:RNA polymerase sigma-70 factor (ECF subfamily)
MIPMANTSRGATSRYEFLLRSRVTRSECARIITLACKNGPVDDLELLRRVVAGDESAFTELVTRYHQKLVQIARYYVRTQSSAEDVAQETWIGVIKGADRFEGRSSMSTWLFRICANRARSIAVRENRVVQVDMDRTPVVASSRFDQGGFWCDPPVPFTELVDDRVANEAMLGAVTSALALLKDPARSVVTLRDVEGLTTSEVADVLGLSEANVRVILHRGRAQIRNIVEDKQREVQK